MPKSTSHAALLALAIDKQETSIPAYVQLYRKFREMILSGAFAARERLPSTRSLALDLQLSRTTVVAAYDQLASEGYIQARRGSGAYVTDLPPDHLLLIQNQEGGKSRAAPGPASLTSLKKQNQTDLAPTRPFQPNAVAFDRFPHDAWARLLSQSWRNPSLDLLGRSDPFGHLPLRQAIAGHLCAWRGIKASPEHIVITCGIADSLDLIFRALAPPNARIWVEDPGFAEIYSTITANRCRAVPLPVDQDGLDVEKAISACPDAIAAIVTPSRQFPLGMTMSLSRRLELLDWARQRGAMVIEDDFDSEYRFSGQPLSPLMALDDSGSVIYLGSFSKVMLRSLRLGYIVCHRAFANKLRSILEHHGGKASLVAQPALAQFISSGEFAAYIRKTRRLYAKRLGSMQDALHNKLADDLVVGKQTGGLHLVAELQQDLISRHSDQSLSRQALQAGIITPPLSTFYQDRAKKQGLILGFAGFDEKTIEEGVDRLSKTIRG